MIISIYYSKSITCPRTKKGNGFLCIISIVSMDTKQIKIFNRYPIKHYLKKFQSRICIKHPNDIY